MEVHREEKKEQSFGAVPEAKTITFWAAGNIRCALGRAKTGDGLVGFG